LSRPICFTMVSKFRNTVWFLLSTQSVECVLCVYKLGKSQCRKVIVDEYGRAKDVGRVYLDQRVGPFYCSFVTGLRDVWLTRRLLQWWPFWGSSGFRTDPLSSLWHGLDNKAKWFFLKHSILFDSTFWLRLAVVYKALSCSKNRGLKLVDDCRGMRFIYTLVCFLCRISL